MSADLHQRKEYLKKWWKNNGKDQRKKKRFMLLEIFPNLKCNRCDFSDWRALQIDHINGSGNKERKNQSNSQKNLLIDILKYPDKYQLLCANCNWIKRYENNELKRKVEI